MDANAITNANSNVVVASIAYTTYELTQLTVALSAVSVAASKLYSCTKNKVTCKRR
ncbi:hypothetical protein QOZ84_01945 [Romboutsia sedimentorum]|uniref:Uncharacterized protein n=1 Tax=Romboutsia sedimentorum TaxID=1368474 RepID=A0ABT7E5U2_9FIRM|nr:hypothetical protein [Romboutsia sedimentorum]MDK2562295.1 hypothetical protein [Romboutsia sedimentorum]MDK2584538.1 hypothetical protein [Romboutsia sedimentorum]